MSEIFYEFRWILASLFCVIIFLILPVELYDYAFTFAVMAGGICTGICIHQVVDQYFSNTHGASIIIVIVIMGLGYPNIKSYHFRRNLLFDRNGISTTGEIVDRKIKITRRPPAYYIIIYKYMANGGFYVKEDYVDFDVYMNYDLGPKITIDYVEGREGISRINKYSLVPNPNAEKEWKEAQEEYRRKYKLN